MSENKKMRTISNHNISEFDVLNYDFKKIIVMYLLLIDNIDNSLYEKYFDEMTGLFIDIKDMLFVCLQDYRTLLTCLENQEEFNK